MLNYLFWGALSDNMSVCYEYDMVSNFLGTLHFVRHDHHCGILFR